MKAQLFQAPSFYYTGQQYRLNPNVGLPTLSAVLNQAGITTEVHDLEALGIRPDGLAKAYAEQPGAWPDVVGFTVTHLNYRGVLDCIRALRPVYDGYIILGGPEATCRAEEVYAEACVDALVVGECEGNIVQILQERSTGIIKGQRAAIEDIPAPLWAKHRPLPPDYWGNEPKIAHPEGISMWSRGCPGKCIFCANAVFGGQKMRFRPPENIRRELKMLMGMGVHSVFVYDDELIGASHAQNRWLHEVADAVAPLGLVYKCQGRCSAEHVTEEALRDLKRMGFHWVMWGVESFSSKVLNSVNKGATEDDIWHTLRLAKKVGIKNGLFLMLGNYGETVEDLAYTAARLGEAYKEELVQWKQLTVTTPLPGSKLWGMAKEEGWLKDAPSSGPQMVQVYNSTPWLTAQEIQEWQSILWNIAA